MNEYIDKNYGTTNSSLEVKQEPIDGDEEYGLGNYPPDNLVTKSLVLKFVKDVHGEYSVIPRIKPDPFYEEFLEDVKLEEENEFNSDLNNNFVTKQDGCKEEIEIKEEILQSNNENAIKMVRCSKCLYTNTEDFVKRHHRRVHITVTKHSCFFCPKKNFKEPLALDCHILKNHRDISGALDIIKRAIFKCSICRHMTLKRNNFRRHLTTHGESRLKKHLDGDNESLTKELCTVDIKKALSTTKFDCWHCGYSTKDKGSIIKHVRLHKEVKGFPFSCKGCSRKFNEKNSLDSHIIKRHIDKEELVKLVTNRVYECELCNYKDVNKNKVLRHKRARHVKKERKKRLTNNRKSKLKLLQNYNT